MRLLATSFSLLAALTLIACSHGNSSSSSTTQQSTAAPAAASPTAASPGTAANGSVPAYPRATAVMSGSSFGTSGSVSTTTDSFETVYNWYRSHLPAGAEMMRASASGQQTAVFKVGNSSIAINSQNGKTEITIANRNP
ncbi:MAG: hypothetical protein ACYC8W_07165 [Candidatus Tyrphobacter sp.]